MKPPLSNINQGTLSLISEETPVVSCRTRLALMIAASLKRWGIKNGSQTIPPLRAGRLHWKTTSIRQDKVLNAPASLIFLSAGFDHHWHRGDA